MLDIDLNRKMKKQKLIYLIVIIICSIGSLTSLFYPYLEKLNVHSGNLDLPKRVLGYEYVITTFVLLSIVINFLITALIENKFWPFFMSIITLGLVYITRFEIHFQGFIDHDYDSKTGTGFLLLFTFSIILFVASAISWLSSFWIKKAALNTHLAQEPESW